MPWSFGVDVGWGKAPLQYGYIYTDRPIYRPGDTVHFRGIVRDTDYGRYPLPSVASVTLKSTPTVSRTIAGSSQV